MQSLYTRILLLYHEPGEPHNPMFETMKKVRNILSDYYCSRFNVYTFSVLVITSHYDLGKMIDKDIISISGEENNGDMNPT